MATKQKSGLYRTKIKIGIGPDGKPIYKYLSGRTKKELEQAKADAYAFYIDGSGRQDDRLFGAYAVEWFKVVKSPGLSPSTVAMYRSTLNVHILPTFGDRRLRAIRPIELQRFVNSFDGAGRSSITRVTLLLSGVFASAVTDGILDKNPMQSIRRPEHKAASSRRSLTEEERSIIVAAIPSHPLGPFVACLYYLGLRRGEAIALKWGDIDWDAGLVHIERTFSSYAEGKVKAPKTRKSVRSIPMPDSLSDILRPLRGHPDSMVFPGAGGKVLSNCKIGDDWAKFIEEVGLSPEITPHYLRHNYITMCWENGIDPYITMSMVGHSSINITMDIYTHLTNRKMEEAQQKVAAMFAAENKVAQKMQRKSK